MSSGGGAPPIRRRDWQEAVVSGLEERSDQLAALLGSREAVERFKTVALHAVITDSALREVDPLSLVAAIRESAALGLEPSGILGEGFIEPRGGLAVFRPMYRGYLKLVRNSGDVAGVDSAVVYANDRFAMRKGTNPGIDHEPFLNAPLSAAEGEPDRGEILGAYAWARFRNGELASEWMPVQELEKARLSSSAVRKGRASPWDTWYSEMARKTVLRRLCKYLPLAPQVRQLLVDDATLDGAETAEPARAALPSRAAQLALAAQTAPEARGGSDDAGGAHRDGSAPDGPVGPPGAPEDDVASFIALLDP